ncbi:MAG: hypothetical protein IKB93_13025, partial [Clostridia bacterium]|nr:hypothetical protein [Clostridia bacterium]
AMNEEPTVTVRLNTLLASSLSEDFEKTLPHPIHTHIRAAAVLKIPLILKRGILPFRTLHRRLQ